MTDVAPSLRAALSDRYTIERELGRGGMATVYLAQDLKHHRRVAIKVLRADVARTLGAERFLREIEIAAGLRHPHILPLFDSGRVSTSGTREAGVGENELLYYVMPYVEGESLADRIARERQLPIEEACGFAREVADALSYAHARGVVHRDIKPGNILIEAGHAVVADFGIARALAESRGGGEPAAAVSTLTDAGISLGTPAYMSPEQAANDRDLDGRSDLYSLGCVLYEMLAGQPPFTGTTVEALVRQHVTVPPPPVTQFRPAVPAPVADALARALAKNPADRFNPVGQFATALQSGAVPAAPALPARSRLRRVLVPVLAVLLLAAGWAWVRSRSAGARNASGLDATARPNSIAVLPFVNMSGDPANEYFGDGVTEEILNALAQFSELRVAARTSAFQFKGRQEDVREIGRRLGVATVLEGSVQRVGDAVRITAQLVDAGTGYHLWSGKYDRRIENLFAVEDEIARTIADTLKVPLGVAVGAALANRRTEDPAAHDLYLRGLALIAERGPALTSAIAYFDSALARDSGYAAAWAGLAQAHELRMYGHEWGPDLAAAKRAAARALALDGTLAPAHAVTATLHRDEWQWAAADSSYRRSLALAPNDAETMDQYAQFLGQTGRADAARRWEERARRLNPLAPVPLLFIGNILTLQRRYDSARAVLTEVAERLPGEGAPYEWMIWGSVMRRRYAEAEGYVGPLVSRSRGDPTVYRKLIRGAADLARRWEALAALPPPTLGGQFDWQSQILWRAMLGDSAGVYRVLERYAGVGVGEVFVFWYEAFDPYRDKPRFKTLMARFGLPYRGEPLP